MNRPSVLDASGELPTAQTTVAGHTFNWAQGIIFNHGYGTGSDLITRYQKIYDTGTLVSDGTLVADPTKITNGVILSDSLLTSDGDTFGSGTFLMPSGTLVSDGVLISDNFPFADGTLVSDGTLISDTFTEPLSVLVGGDNTARMR